MSVTFGPCTNDSAALSAFQARYPDGVDFIALSPEALDAIEWPKPNPVLSALLHSLSEDEVENLSLNVHNSGGARLMQTLGFQLDMRDGPSGRCELREFQGRCLAALSHVAARAGVILGEDLSGQPVRVVTLGTDDNYLIDRLQHLSDIAEGLLQAGFSHISWG